MTQSTECTVTPKEPVAPLKEICLFLSNYAAWLLGCGATCIRIEKNVRRMSEAFGVTADINIMPSHIHLSVWNSDQSDSYNNIRKIQKTGISFNLNTQLSKLSWAVADGKLTFNEANDAFQQIQLTRPANKWLVLVLASLANASFCRLFGGDPTSMLIVLVATLAGYRLKQIMLEDKADVRLVFFCSAFVSSVIAAGGHLFNWGNTPEIALGTSVLYLIPGIPYINAVSDLLDGHYLCSFNRLIDATVLTTCLSAGLCGGLFLMDLNWF